MTGADSDFSPVENELPLRWYRRLRLAPAEGLGTGRRALFFAALTWLPIAVWAAVRKQSADTDAAEPLLRHFGVHVRCLVAIPLFVLAEGSLHRTFKRIASQFVASGVVGPAQSTAFARSLGAMRRLRNSSAPWVLVLGMVAAWSVVARPDVHGDEYSWAASDGGLGFGGWWYAYVARPVFVAMLLGWIWRMLLMTVCFWRIGRLDLSLVPTHPDRAAGLAFVEGLPTAYWPVTLGLSAVAASRFAHQIAYHGASLKSFAPPAAGFAVIWTLLALLPLLALAPTLLGLRARSIQSYGALVGEQGRLVHRRWIQKEPVEDAPILGAPEIGGVADANAMYDAVRHMRSAPIGKPTLAAILIPIALPMLAVVAIRLPIKELLLNLIKAVL
jgi:hypothetical protein